MVAIITALISGIVSIFVIIVAILTLLAINNLHKIPDILNSLANIEKLLKTLVTIEKKKIENNKPESEPGQIGEPL